MKRVLCLYFPKLSIDWRRQRERVLRDERTQSAIGVVQRQSGTLRLVQVNDIAWRAGLRSGMTLAEGQALLPALITLEDDIDGDRQALESLAIWAQRFAPLAHLEDAQTLLLDISGCQRLFGGDDQILHQSIAGARQRGFFVRAAIADTPGAAWALAHTHPQPGMVVEPGRTAAAIASLPVHALRVDQHIVSLLSSIGVETIEALLHLPRAGLAARFDPQLLQRLDQVLGVAPEPLVAYEPQRAVSVRMQFAPTQRREVLHEAVRRTLAVFCEKLARQVQGVRQLFLTFYCEWRIADCERNPHQSEIRNSPFAIEINLSRASRSFTYWEKLVRARLEAVQLPAPARAVSVWALHIEPLDDEQDELFDTDRQDARQLAELVDRLTVRLGPRALAQAQLVSEHQPERAYRYAAGFRVPATAGRQAADPPRRSSGFSLKSAVRNPQSAMILQGIRPLRLIDPPRAIAVSALFPEGPPVQFQDRAGQHIVAWCEGPERIETGWWRGPYVQRDYYRLVDQTGRRFWIFRQLHDRSWYLHGWFD